MLGARAHLPPQQRAGAAPVLERDERAREAGEGGLRAAVEEVQSGLPAREALGARSGTADALVLPLVLGERGDARLAPGDEGGLLEVQRLARRRDPDEPVGRRGLVAELGDPQREPAAAGADPAAAREAVDDPQEPREVGHLGRVGIPVLAVGRAAATVRMEADRVGLDRAEAPAAARAERPVAVVDAGHRAQEARRADSPLDRQRRQLADHDLGAAVGPLDRRAGGADQPAVEVRRHRRAAARPAAALAARREAQVRLVPDQVPVDLPAIARGHRPGERAELARARVEGAAAPRPRAARPHRPRARDREHHAHPVLAHEGDREVQLMPAVAAAAVVAGTEPARPAAPGRRDPRPRGVQPHHVDPEVPPRRDGVRGARGSVEQQALVLDADLDVGSRGRRGRRGEQEQRGAERRRAR